MAKCDIQITFDRTDRTYRGGESVSGEVLVRVNKDIRCDGILLTHVWKTHGRGNTAHGNKREIRLSGPVPLHASQELRFPFEFTSERTPLTYHGHIINVDHYVHVGVDVPWAFDPKQEEEYIVLPGERPAGMSGDRTKPIHAGKKSQNATKFVMFGVLAVFLLVFSIFFIFLLPLILIGGGCYWGWKKMIASRMGKVELNVPHVVVGPGDRWPLEMSFTPKKTFSVNGIAVKIFARETAISGSGTNRSTHRHTLHEETHTLHPALSLTAGEPFSKRFVVDFPQTDAWSLDASDNDVEWFAEVRVDVPRFPDWTKKIELQVVPAGFLDPLESLTIAPPERTEKAFAEVIPTVIAPAKGLGGQWLSAPLVVAGPPDADSPVDIPPVAERSVSDSPVEVNADQETVSLLALVDAIVKAGRFSSERSELVAEAAEHVYDVAIVIERIVTTFGFTGADARYEKGRTVVGKLAETDQAIQLFAIDTSNATLDEASIGATWRTQATVLKWDSLYNRLVLLEVSGEGSA